MLPGYFYSPLLRSISFFAAAGFSLLLLILPMVFVQGSNPINHGLMALLLLGVCAGFVHGVGFRPSNIGWALLFSPLLAWPLIAWAAIIAYRALISP